MTPPREPKDPYITLVPTPDVGERVVQLHVPQRLFTALTSVTQGMTMTAFIAALVPTDTTAAVIQGYDSYTLTQPVLNDTGSDGTLSFYFAKPKATTALHDLTPFKTETKWIDLPWPGVLLYLYASQGRVDEEREEFPSAYTNYNASLTFSQKSRVVYEDRLGFVPAQQVSTEVIIREYLSNLPFTDVVVETPVTETVQYLYKGMRRTLECLHPDVTIPELLKGGKRVPNFGTPFVSERPYGQGQFYPATEMSTWEDHIFKAVYTSDNGVYYLTTFEALAPALPDPTLL